MDFNKVSYRTIEVDFNSEVDFEIAPFSMPVKIVGLYIYFKNEFTNEQEVELYSVFGESASHKGTEIYDKCKKRFTLKTEDVAFLLSKNKESSQSMFIRIGNTDGLQNTAYITLAYKTLE